LKICLIVFRSGIFLSEASAEIRRDCETVNFSDLEGPTVYMGSKSARSIQEAEGKALYKSCLNLSGSIKIVLNPSASSSCAVGIIGVLYHSNTRH